MREPKTINELRDRVETYLRQRKVKYRATLEGEYEVQFGTTAVTVRLEKWIHELNLVRMSAPVALNITKITPKLTRFLAEENRRTLFGKFSLDTKNKAILYEHTLLGDFLDPDELFVAMGTVVGIADDYDELVSEMAGGKRAIDVWKAEKVE